MECEDILIFPNPNLNEWFGEDWFTKFGVIIRFWSFRPGMTEVNANLQKYEGPSLNTTKSQYEAYINNKALVGIRGCLRHHQLLDCQVSWCIPAGWWPDIEMFQYGLRCWLEHTKTLRRYVWKFSVPWACLVCVQIIIYRLMSTIANKQWTGASSNGMFSWICGDMVCTHIALYYVSL